MAKEKNIQMNMKNIESVDVSNLLELTLSNMNFSKNRIIHYSFLIEEALFKWRENLSKDSELKYIVKKTKKKIMFTFSIEGEKCNPFLVVSNKNGESAPLEKMVDNLLSGVGTELKYKYKKHTNIITLTLPITKDYEKKLFVTNLVFLMIPIVVQQFFFAVSNNIDAITLGFVDAKQMSMVTLVTKFCSIPDVIGITISVVGVAVLSQYMGRRDRKSVNQGAGIILKFSFVVGLIFCLIAFFIPKTVLKLYTNDEELINYGATYFRIIAIPILLNVLERALFCFMQVAGEVKRTMIYSVISCSINVVLNVILTIGLFGLPKMGYIGVGIATMISFTVQGILVVIYTIKQKDIKIDLFAKNKELLKTILKLLLPTSAQSLSYVLLMNIIASAFSHKDLDIIVASSVFSFINNAFVSTGVGYKNSMAILMGRMLGKNQFDIAKERATLSIKIVQIITLMFIPLFVLVGLLVHILPLDLSENALNYYNLMVIVGVFNLYFGNINKTICGGMLQAGSDAIGSLVADVSAFYGIIAPICLLSIYNVVNIPASILIIILCADEVISFPFKYFRYRQNKWLKSITKDAK